MLKILSRFTKHTFTTMTSSSEVATRIQERALQAENMLSSLNHQLRELQAVFIQTAKKKLRKENGHLQNEVERLKKYLMSLETKQGIPQYYDFSKTGELYTAPVVLPASAAGSELSSLGNFEVQSLKQQKQKTELSVEKHGQNGGKKQQPEAPIDVGRLDFRIGRIVSVKQHPDADSLYVEEIDVGENKLRTVVSGLVKFVPLEEMQDCMVVVLCNLKPAKMRGITSEAMVMCASTPEKVEMLIPPEGCQAGDIVEFVGYNRNPDSVLNPKKKIFETCAPHLKTDSNRIATYKGIPFGVPGKGSVIAPSLENVQIK